MLAWAFPVVPACLSSSANVLICCLVQPDGPLPPAPGEDGESGEEGGKEVTCRDLPSLKIPSLKLHTPHPAPPSAVSPSSRRLEQTFIWQWQAQATSTLMHFQLKIQNLCLWLEPLEFWKHWPMFHSQNSSIRFYPGRVETFWKKTDWTSSVTMYQSPFPHALSAVSENKNLSISLDWGWIRRFHNAAYVRWRDDVAWGFENTHVQQN